MELEEIIPNISVVTKHLRRVFPFIVDATISNQHLPSKKIFIYVTLSPNHFCETFFPDIDDKISEIIICEATLYLRSSFPELLEGSSEIRIRYYPSVNQKTLLDEATKYVNLLSL